MNLTQSAYGTWSGGRYMHFGEVLEEDRYLDCIKHAYESGIRTFVTADVYGTGRADAALGEALADYERETYSLVGMLGHDFDKGQRQGSAGFPRFTDPSMHDESGYADFLKRTCERSLENCRADKFDLVMLHNPDELGYTSKAVWEAMATMKEGGLTDQLGIAPGPANGFTLDLMKCFNDFSEYLDWAMIILNPLEPWPGRLVLDAAEQNNIDLLTRVVDYGGLFHGSMPRGHEFRPGDHRAYRPEGWVERGWDKMDVMNPIREKYGLTWIQFAAIWNLSHPAVKSVVPTFLQEAASDQADAKPIKDQISEIGALPEIRFTPEEVEEIAKLGDNTGCMTLKGASERHNETPSERPDEWAMRDDLLSVASQYGLGSF